MVLKQQPGIWLRLTEIKVREGCYRNIQPSSHVEDKSMITRFIRTIFLGILTAVADTAIAQHDPDENELTMVYLGAS